MNNPELFTGVGWNKAIEQLDAIEGDSLIQSQWCRGSVRVALDVIPIYESSKKRPQEYTLNTERLDQISNTVIQTLHPKPNWSGLWTLHHNLIGPYEYGERIEFYPAVLFVAYVYEMSRD